MRLDKLLAHLGYGSRKEVKTYIRKGYVLVNGMIVTDDDCKVNEEEDEITLLEEEVSYQKEIYWMLHKPKGYVSATLDTKDPTVLELIPQKQKGIFPVGRLDKDTTGLLILTNNGVLAHELLSPKHHVAKVYELSFTGNYLKEYHEAFQKGIVLEDGYQCKPALFELLASQRGRITIYEGKFHQIKKMMQALGLEVTELKRISFGGIDLPDELMEGQSRPLTEQEISILKTWQDKKS